MLSSQKLWNQGMHQCFKKLCWPEVLPHVKIEISTTRFSLNLINAGLVFHHDFSLEEFREPLITYPGVTFCIHLGMDAKDMVYLEYEHNLERRTVCIPRTAYVFPGYCVSHRTCREYTLTKDKKHEQPRYSLVVFLRLKKKKLEELDKWFHEKFCYADDNYELRKQNAKFIQRAFS